MTDFPVIRNAVSIADPGAPANALRPTASGALPTVSGGYAFDNITTSATTLVKTGAGVLHSITVNTKGTVASTVVAYDNTAGSGTKIGTVDSLNLSGTFTFDAAFSTGLTIVTTGAPDITVSYS